MRKLTPEIQSIILLLLLSTIFSSCYRGLEADLVIHNAKIHTMNDAELVSEAIAIKDGKIIEVGPNQQILNKYSSKKVIDAGGRELYPGLTDAHAHILSYMNQKLSVDLVGVKSYQEMLNRISVYQSKKNKKIVIGRGWDQATWGEKNLPTNEQLNKAYPTVPVCLYRIDGHAALVNDAMIKLAGINPDSIIAGGSIEMKNGKTTGILIDNAMNLVQKHLPDFSEKEKIQTVEDIQEELFQYGITGVHEAGIAFKDIQFFRTMIDKGLLSLNIYAMLLPSKENTAFAEKNGIYRYKNLSIRSFKVFGDGALGSRGAYLKKPYSDDHSHHGLLTTSIGEMQNIATLCERLGYQMNTHAIGDSTNSIVLEMYQKVFEKNKDHRWRIEHAQVVDPSEIGLFGKFGIFPSVQPTHAVSDQRWAKDRLGENRMKGAYAYKSLLKSYGMVAIGTDFPVELTNPFATIKAAVERKDQSDFPAQGFYPNEALTFIECIKGMTLWAAFSSFDETRLGSLEVGKDASFVIFEKPLSSMKTDNFAWMTFILGKSVFSADSF